MLQFYLGEVDPIAYVLMISYMILWRCKVSKKEKRAERLLSEPFRSDVHFQEVLLVLNDHGYLLKRSRGSHFIFDHPIHQSICIPKSEPIKVAYIRMIALILKKEEETK